MIPITELTKTMLVEVAGAGEITIERYARYATRNFLRDSEIWFSEHYDVEVTENARGFKVIECPAPIATDSDVNDDIVYWTGEYGVHSIRAYDATCPERVGLKVSPVGGNKYRVNDAITAGTKLRLYVVYTTTMTSDELPDEVSEWLLAIRAGALAQMYLMPAQPWTDSNAGQIYALDFQEGIKMAKRTGSNFDQFATPKQIKFSW